MSSDGYELASQTSMIQQLQSDLIQVRYETSQLADMRRSIARLDTVQEQVNLLTERTGKIEKRLDQIYEQLMLGESLAQARHEHTRLERKLREDFIGRDAIRTLAISLISAAGAAMIRDKVVDPQTVIDEAGRTMLKEADHWLAAALIAIVNEQLDRDWNSPKAWGYVAAADQASGQLKSDLFLALFCSLQRRQEAAAWSMNQYLEKLDPQALGREFSHVINALAEGELGEQARSYAHQALNRWGRRLPLLSRSQFETCRAHLLANREQIPSAFPALQRHVDPSQWRQLEAGWTQNAACGAAARMFQVRLSENRAADARLSRHTHSQRALRALIQQPEPDEIELKRKIHFQELIMQCGGDVKRAAELDAERGDPFAETSDLATFLTQATFEPEAYGLVPQAQRFAVTCAAGWIMKAAESVVSDAQVYRPSTMTIQWDGWSDQIDAEIPAETETARLINQVNGYIAATRQARRPSAMTVFAALAGMALAIVALLQVHGPLLWVLITIGLCMVMASVTDVATYPTRRAKVASAAAEEQKEAGRIIPLLVDQARDLLRLWDQTGKEGLAELGRALGELPCTRAD